MLRNSSDSARNDGRVWLAARGHRQGKQLGGIVAGIGEDWEYFQPPQAPRYATSIIELVDGRMLFTGGYGAVFFDGSEWTSMDAPLRSTPNPQVTMDPAGSVWVTTRNRGVMRFRDGVWTTFDKQQAWWRNRNRVGLRTRHPGPSLAASSGAYGR